MLLKEVLNNTGWTSADAERIFLLWIRPAMCGSAFIGTITLYVYSLLTSRHSHRRQPSAWAFERVGAARR